MARNLPWCLLLHSLTPSTISFGCPVLYSRIFRRLGHGHAWYLSLLSSATQALHHERTPGRSPLGEKDEKNFLTAQRVQRFIGAGRDEPCNIPWHRPSSRDDEPCSTSCYKPLSSSSSFHDASHRTSCSFRVRMPCSTNTHPSGYRRKIAASSSRRSRSALQTYSLPASPHVLRFHGRVEEHSGVGPIP